MEWFKVLSIIFALMGGMLLVAAGREFARRRGFIRNSTVASGTIETLSERRDGEEISFFPKVRFQTSAGREVTFQSEVGSSLQARTTGDTVSVRYRPDQPYEAEIDNFLALWGLALVLGVLGVVFFFVGLGSLLGVLPV